MDRRHVRRIADGVAQLLRLPVLPQMADHNHTASERRKSHRQLAARLVRRIHGTDTMRKRGARIKNNRSGHTLTPQQVRTLVTPIHVAIELLPMGLYNEQHAHDLAAFLNVAQLASDEAGNEDVHTIANGAADVLIAMRDRAKTGKAWNCTHDERETLKHAVVVIDRWLRTLTTRRWGDALRRVYVLCDKATAEGKEELDLIEARRINERAAA